MVNSNSLCDEEFFRLTRRKREGVVSYSERAATKSGGKRTVTVKICQHTLNKGEVSGLVLKIKDVFEVILKFSVLPILSEWMSDDGKKKFVPRNFIRFDPQASELGRLVWRGTKNL